MEMIMISPSQLKVMMDAEDMKKYDLNCDAGIYEGISRRIALRSILQKAKERTGFSSDGKRILVKMFPSKDGGCEMFVTRLGEADQTESDLKKPCAAKDGMTVYAFDSFDKILLACKRLCFAGFRGESSAFRDNERGKYYLLLSSDNPLAAEMGGEAATHRAIGYINEFCSLICENAVEVLPRFI